MTTNSPTAAANIAPATTTAGTDPEADLALIADFRRNVRIALQDVDYNPFDPNYRVVIVDMLVNGSADADAAYARALAAQESSTD